MIKKIYLSNFRNFEKQLFEFDKKTTVIVGPNASGKTNILESVYLLSTGKSFKAKVEEEMINYNEDLARIKGLFKDDEKLEVVLTRGYIEIDTGKQEKTQRKRLLINGVAKRLSSFAGNFKTVLFGPWDMELVIESPSVRRNYLDSVLSQVDYEYRRASLSYDKGLRQRNKLLYRIREEGISRSQLLFWDKLLIKNGNYITRKREEYLEYLNNNSKLNDHQFMLEYDKSTISEHRLEQYASEEVAAATTLVGPHRDDFIFHIKSHKDRDFRELVRYGSRGEQRMGVLWIKLGELKFIEKKTEEKPTLLLDDIFSELDDRHREIVFKAISGYQTIITTADEDYIKELEKGEVIELK